MLETKINIAIDNIIVEGTKTLLNMAFIAL